MSDFRVAIVGAGPMGYWHARAARRAGGRIAVVVDVDPSRGRALGVRHPGAQVATSLAAALDAQRVEIVHICTPLPSHMPLALEAVARGAHVIVEKPFAESLADTQRLLATAAAQHVMAVPVHQFPFQSGIRTALANLPQLGPICLLQLTICSSGAEHQPARADTVAAEILPHALSLLHRCFPGTLGTARWSAIHPRVGEWHLHTELAGAAIAVHISMSGRPPMNEFRLMAAKGRIHADLFHGFAIQEPPEIGRWYKVARPAYLGLRTLAASTANLARRGFRWQPAYPGLNELVTAVYGAIGNAREPPVEGAETLAVAAAWDRIRGVVTAGQGSPGSPRNDLAP